MVRGGRRGLPSHLMGSVSVRLWLRSCPDVTLDGRTLPLPLLSASAQNLRPAGRLVGLDLFSPVFFFTARFSLSLFVILLRELAEQLEYKGSTLSNCGRKTFKNTRSTGGNIAIQPSSKRGDSANR